jgi:hypothetical protein
MHNIGGLDYIRKYNNKLIIQVHNCGIPDQNSFHESSGLS